jgi:chemotaxis protein CheZ
MSPQTVEVGDSAELEHLFDSIALSVKPRVAAVALKAAAAPETTGDSAELEKLFDSIAHSAPAAAPACGADLSSDADSAELEDLFDSVLSQKKGGQAASLIAARAEEHDPAKCPANKVVTTVGHLTRQLHDTLAELGYDRHLQDAAVAELPDARQRIAYVVGLTEQAASRALNAVDIAIPVQESLAADATAIGSEWDKVFSGECDVTQFKALAQQTREYLKAVPGHTEVTRSQLREVMMAQEFQDLTGQVLKRITEVANNLETQLLKLLVENAPAPIKNTEALSRLNGPVIDGGAPEVVANQAQVDELLESLGF